MCYLQFGLYFFSFLLTESVVNERAAIVLGVNLVNAVYAFGLLCTALGYLLYSVLYKIRKKEDVIPFCTITIIASLLTCTISQPLFFIFIAYTCLISFGYIGGYVHFRVSCENESSHFAIKLAAAASIAIVFQFFVQLFHDSSLFFCASITLSSLLVIFMHQRTPIISDIAKNPKHKYKDSSYDSIIKSDLVICIIIVSLMSMILGIEDSIMVYKNAAGELLLFSGIRLFYALGLLIAGMAADIKHRRFLPLSTVCAVMLSTIVITFLNGSSLNYNLSMGFMYFYCGFYVMYLTLMFMDLAALTNNSRLVAGSGRIVRSVITALVVLLLVRFDNTLSYTACLIINCILSILVVLVFYIGEVIKNSAREEMSISKDNIGQINNLENWEKFCDYFRFTDKEKESFILLISTEDTIQSIADNMGISRRVLQRHISSMYEKTNTQTRVGLLMAYASFLEENV